MNNLAMGNTGNRDHAAWDYYETIGGGMGASSISDGLDAVQTHMTNTLNTPIESLEMKYPLRVNRYQIRTDSAGQGYFKGGQGLIREYAFLSPAQVTILSERRLRQPWGISVSKGFASPCRGEASALSGKNLLNGKPLGAKQSFEVTGGDVVCIITAGGGGYNT
jgi:N-methylhydantoinase B